MAEFVDVAAIVMSPAAFREVPLPAYASTFGLTFDVAVAPAPAPPIAAAIEVATDSVVTLSLALATTEIPFALEVTLASASQALMLLLIVLVASDMPMDPPIRPADTAPEPTSALMVPPSKAERVMLPTAVVELLEDAFAPWMKAAIVLLIVLRESAPAPENAAPMGDAAAENVAATDRAVMLGAEVAVSSTLPAELIVDARL